MQDPFFSITTTGESLARSGGGGGEPDFEIPVW